MPERLTRTNLAGLKVSTAADREVMLNMMIYGQSGIGKTVLAGSADAVPEMRPVLLVDVEGGSESLRRTYPDVEMIRVVTWNDIQHVYDELHTGNTGYRTVILDSLTEIQKFSMNQIMKDLVANNPGRDEDVASMREWGKNLEQIRRMVRGFRDLPGINTIFTALEKSDRNERTGVTSVKPSLSGKMADEVAAFLDFVGYYYVKAVDGENQRLLLTSATPTQVAKDRSGKMPLVIEAPTMQTIFDYFTDKVIKTEKENEDNA